PGHRLRRLDRALHRASSPFRDARQRHTAEPPSIPAVASTIMRLVVMGGGRMGEALVAGLLNAGWPAPELHVVEPVAARRKELSGRYDLNVGDAPVAA